jgi:GGDEF domain-containing protein
MPISDPLTQLPTVGWIRENWEEFSQNLPLVDLAIYFDIDSLICTNQNYGWKVTEDKIVEVANRLRSYFPSEYPVARFSGDEFLVLGDSSQISNDTLTKLLKSLEDHSLKYDSELIEFFSVSCCTIKVSQMDSWLSFGRQINGVCEAIGNAKRCPDSNKRVRQGVLVNV